MKSARLDASRTRPHAALCFRTTEVKLTAQAQQVALMCGATTFQDIFAAQGETWEEAFDKQAECLGMTRQEYQAMLRQKMGAVQAAGEDPASADARRRRKRGARSQRSGWSRLLQGGRA